MDKPAVPRGYRFAGVPCGIRSNEPDRLDLALVVSDTPATAAAAFTHNRVVAAPVKLCRERLPRANARAIVVCSGNANACTGQRGLDDAFRMAGVTAERVGCRPEQVLVASTGVIGRHLPMPKIEAGIAAAAGQLSAEPESFYDRAARAILTTDTKIKTSTRVLRLASGDVPLAGFAKNGPNRATLLAVVLTDARVAMEDLAALTPRVADQTFNCISVEGHTSTNDTLLILANGQGPKLHGADLVAFTGEVTRVCAE